MPTRDRADLRPARSSSVWIVVIVLLLLGGAAWWYWSRQQAPAPAAAVQPPVPDMPPEPPAPPPAPPQATGPLNPIETPPDATLPPLANSDKAVESALDGLLGNRSVQSFLQLDGFVNRFVATVDNLPREEAPAKMWPINPTAERFSVERAGDAQAISSANAERYTPMVNFVESIDAASAVSLYTKLYPLFQKAYEELGYPNRYFNDRLVEVIDHLLKAPEPSAPVRVTVTEVKGSVPSTAPWTRYEFADPALQSLSAGQKMMVRVGVPNERRLKAKLIELRQKLVSNAPAAKK